jgi:hypothetical protein
MKNLSTIGERYKRHGYNKIFNNWNTRIEVPVK